MWQSYLRLGSGALGLRFMLRRLAGGFLERRHRFHALKRGFSVKTVNIRGMKLKIPFSRTT